MGLDMNPISSAKHRIVIAHDDSMLLKLLSKLLTPEFEIVASVRSGEEALGAVWSLQPNILVVDIEMPQMSGIQIAARLQEMGFASTKVVFLASLQHRRLMQTAMKSGAHGFVFKGDIFADLPTAISEVLAGRPFISPAYL
jgi:two-component system, NarL family, response regulator DesR